MAKSIFEILADRKTTTSVPGYGDEMEHTIPAKLFPSPEQFENGPALLEWAEEHGYTHSLLQKGIQKGLIDLRATFKACKKGDNWSTDYGQKNVDATDWTITERPKAGSSKTVKDARFNDCMKLIGNMSIAGLPKDQIRNMAIPVYGEELVNSIFSTLEGLNK